MNSPQSRLGRYLLLRRLAAGGMGEVYLAKVEGAANFTKHVAIKRILPHLAQDEGFVRRFIDEAHLMVQLHHGNIVPVLELADEGGELFLVMEYLPGRDLKAVIHRLRADKTA
ncbi:MAG: protein kinase, partial [Myxococcales bacterium]|nr:protein kinase [Myxococcales bacterium]